MAAVVVGVRRAARFQAHQTLQRGCRVVLMTAYDFSWFVALFVGGVTHFALMKLAHALQRRWYGSSASGSNSARFAYDALQESAALSPDATVTATPRVLTETETDTATDVEMKERAAASGPVELENTH